MRQHPHSPVPGALECQRPDQPNVKVCVDAGPHMGRKLVAVRCRWGTTQALVVGGGGGTGTPCKQAPVELPPWFPSLCLRDLVPGGSVTLSDASSDDESCDGASDSRPRSSSFSSVGSGDGYGSPLRAAPSKFTRTAVVTVGGASIMVGSAPQLFPAPGVAR
jgi:hypothetical protein